MTIERIIVTSLLGLLSIANCLGQASVAIDPPVISQPAKGSGSRLHVEMIKAPSEVAEALAGPPKCDSHGDIYLKTTPDGVSAIHKLNAKGERVALFQPKSPSLQIDFSAYFSIAPNSDLYELVYAREI